MLWETIKRGQEIFKSNEVILKECRPPHYFHFLVKQRNESWTDVWYKQVNGQMQWDCNSTTRTSKGKLWGCVMNTRANKNRPYCSHTMACRLKLEQLYKNKENGKTRKIL